MNDNYFASVVVIVRKEKQVLLVRHTYGSANGKLLNPGGFLQQGEMPFEAAVREVLEETGCIVQPLGMLGIRCETKGWYMAILADYVSGMPHSDGCENSEVLFMDCSKALNDPFVTDTAKKLITLAISNNIIVPTDAGKGRIMFA